jgi:hypothetical protein
MPAFTWASASCGASSVALWKLASAWSNLEDEAAIDEGPGEVGADRQRPLAALERLGKAPQQTQHIAALVERFGVLGTQRQHPIIRAERLFETPEPAQQDAAVEVGVGEARIDLNRSVVACERLAEAPEVLEGVAAIAQRFKVIGLDRQRPVIAAECLVVAPEMRQSGAEQAHRIEVIGRGGEEDAAETLGLGGPAALISGDGLPEDLGRGRRTLRRFRLVPDHLRGALCHYESFRTGGAGLGLRLMRFGRSDLTRATTSPQSPGAAWR